MWTLEECYLSEVSLSDFKVLQVCIDFCNNSYLKGIMKNESCLGRWFNSGLAVVSPYQFLIKFIRFKNIGVNILIRETKEFKVILIFFKNILLLIFDIKQSLAKRERVQRQEIRTKRYYFFRINTWKTITERITARRDLVTDVELNTTDFFLFQIDCLVKIFHFSCLIQHQLILFFS